MQCTNKYQIIITISLRKIHYLKGGKVVVTKVAYPAAVTAGLCGEGGAVQERGVGGAVLQALAAAAAAAYRKFQ